MSETTTSFLDKTRTAERDPTHDDYWEGDKEFPVDYSHIPPTEEVVMALMVTSYENLAGHPILPTKVLRDFANDLEIYNMSRTIKRHDDAIEFFQKRHADRVHIVAFIESMFDIIEDVHRRGMGTDDILRGLRKRAEDLVPVSIRFNNTNPGLANGTFAERVWQIALSSYWPEDVLISDPSTA